MKGRLIKTQYNELGYALYIQPCSISNKLKEIPPLSPKNCQTIANGYDLYELADEVFEKRPKEIPYVDEYDFKQGVMVGFQKALSILGDKKYSEQDVRDAYFNGEKDSYTKGGQTKEMENQFIQSLQQNEWDVDIVMEINLNGKNGLDRAKMIPKLDPDGCLILKRI